MHPAYAANRDGLAKPGDPAAVALGWQAWDQACAQVADPDVARRLGGLAEAPAAKALLAVVFGHSPFLTGCLVREPEIALEILEQGPDAGFAAVLDTVERRPTATRQEAVARDLRLARRRIALIAGLADLAGLWTVETVVARLSRFADAAISHAIDHLLAAAAADGALAPPMPATPSVASGYVVIGMGKLGGGELNYSSDIDLIVLFDPEVAPYTGSRPIQDFFVRLTRRLVTLLDEFTADGYVFRTDLRLRPDPLATPIAVSTRAATTYYESLGQNWERSAMIKARPVAGDLEAGRAFLEELRPFMWRRHLDFAAIQDIHSIKRQIQTHRGTGAIQAAGQNVKVGPGGIREIEFFAQTQQLIWGGRHPALRVRATVETLTRLVEGGLLKQQVADELTEAYWFLRKVEHRLQMIADRQTHTVPEDDDARDAVARFAGFAGREAFDQALTAVLSLVSGHYAQLFDDAPDLGAQTDRGGSLVFTGVESDPATLATLADLGFDRPDTVARLIRAWHHGHLRATRSTRSREILTELVPALVAAFGRTPNPDHAFVKFNDFLANLPAGVQLFSLFRQHPSLLDLLAEIMGTAPRLAEYLSRNAQLLDAVLDAGFFEPLAGKPVLAAALAARQASARDFQDTLDAARRWAGDLMFQVAVQQLRGQIDAARGGVARSDVAEISIAAMLAASEVAFAERCGRVAGADLAVLGFGKLGSRALTEGSDLDLVFVYQLTDGGAVSDGERELAPATYFTRLGQRLITALTAQTGEGGLFEVDLRLRPSGNDGPLASELSAFEAYYDNGAWNWELMALTRARPVAGPPALTARLAAIIGAVLSRPRDGAVLARDVVDMRRRMAAEHGTDDVFSIKHVRGGLIDVEFIAQYLQLRHAAEAPQILDTHTATALEKLGDAGLLTPEATAELIAAAQLYGEVQAMTRLCVVGAADLQQAPAALCQTLARCGGTVDIAALEAKLAAAQAGVRARFAALVENEAAAEAVSDIEGG